MKRLVLMTLFLISLTAISGQRSIDRLFDRYAGRDGFTTVSLSGDLLNLAARFEDNDDEKELKARITGIRILTQDDEDFPVVNFLDFIEKDLDLNDYEEFMRVKESHQDLRMLVRLEGRRVTEFLLVTGGDDNALIQVKGNMSVSDARRLCDNARRNHGISIFADFK